MILGEFLNSRDFGRSGALPLEKKSNSKALIEYRNPGRTPHLHPDVLTLAARARACGRVPTANKSFGL